MKKLTTANLENVKGGIWDYSNRLGYVGEQLEANKDQRYGWGGLLDAPKNLDDAYNRNFQGWVTVP